MTPPPTPGSSSTKSRIPSNSVLPRSRMAASSVSKRSRGSRAATSRWSESTSSIAHIHQAVDSIAPSWRGELEITDAISWLVDHGFDVRPQELTGWWIDTGKMEDMLDANRLVLQDIARDIGGIVAEDCTIQGNVVVSPGATIVGSTLRGPLIIGPGTRIENSYVGPFSAIGADCLIRQSEIEHSIVMERTKIIDVPNRIEDSLIGRDVELSRSTSKPVAYKIMLGDHSRVGIL